MFLQISHPQTFEFTVDSCIHRARWLGELHVGIKYLPHDGLRGTDGHDALERACLTCSPGRL